ncbi:hypothetical protein [Streptomyces europaeiscabiei]
MSLVTSGDTDYPPSCVHGAALADALAVVGPDRRPGEPAPLNLLTA